MVFLGGFWGNFGNFGEFCGAFGLFEIFGVGIIQNSGVLGCFYVEG